MHNLIRNGKLIADDPWDRIETSADVFDPRRLGDQPLLLPIDIWASYRDALGERSPKGVWFDAHDEPEQYSADIGRFDVIAVNFPVFSDGRGLSIGRLLRERYRFEGELRAIGDVQRDFLIYMFRCGFDAFCIREDHDPEAALAGLTGYSEYYQSSFREPLPLFRRRA